MVTAQRDFEVHLRTFSLEDRVTRGTPEPKIVKRGRPKKYRKAYKAARVRVSDHEQQYIESLRKMLKRFKWMYFATATFDRRIKTPLSIFENEVLKNEYAKWLPPEWEP